MRMPGHLRSLPGAGSAKALSANARAFRAGVRDARALQPTTLTAPPPAPNELERYFDAHTEGPGLWKWRHYFRIYERHLAKFVGQEFTLVEVGIFSGGSLFMWREYFGAQCRIIGVDIEEKSRLFAEDGFEVFIGDQADPNFWADFRREVPEVHVLIDDGGHQAHQQQATLREVLPHLQPGGVYICEDIDGATHVFHSYIDGLTRPLSSDMGTDSKPAPIHEHIESVHRYPIVVVIEKPAAQVPPFEAPRHGTQWQPWTGPSA
jgi:hypothetical protein